MAFSLIHPKPQNTTTASTIDAYKQTLAEQARLLEKDEPRCSYILGKNHPLYHTQAKSFLSHEQRLKFTQMQYRTYAEGGAKATLSNFITPSHPLALKFVLLYFCHQAKHTSALSFQQLNQWYQHITGTPLILTSALRHDFLEANTMIPKTKRLNEICRILLDAPLHHQTAASPQQERIVPAPRPPLEQILSPTGSLSPHF